jgi:serine/threonine-protein kinase
MAMQRMIAETGSAGEESPADRFSDWTLIGRGGSADVYSVFDRELGIRLAIKILKQAHSGDRRYVESLRREVLISRKLRHANICAIHDLYEGPQGVGIVMDLIEGSDLKAWMASHRDRLLETIDQRMTVLRKLMAALEFAHSQITHRDLKPANIFIKNDDIATPIIMDFGLSSLPEQGEAGGLQGGTPKYMAPEQLMAPATVDRRADIYAMGMIAYELLTGGQIPPCSLKDSARTGALPVFAPEDILPPSAFCAALPPELDRVVLQMLDHDPDKRPQSAAEAAAILERVRLRDPFAPAADAGDLREVAMLAPAGTYTVGERGGAVRACDQPHRKVTLSAFRISPTPVTNAQYRAFLKATGYGAPALIDHPRFLADDQPVVMVSWEDASTYARWAGGRLPTEMEWEAAARAGGDAPWPWGASRPLNSQANIDGVCAAPTPVGSYVTGANAWGLSDMCGNVWEWCADPWDESWLKRMPADARDPIAEGAPEMRAIRGGSFDSPSMTGRCAFRHRAPRGEKRADLGFRIVYEA